MTQSARAISKSEARPISAERRIALRTKGRTHGPITRLMSPGDVGELVKPFVFLDYFEMDRVWVNGFPAHPHSGIATHTTLLRGAFDYGDSTGKSGTLRQGNLEWMKAGGGVWHWGNPRPGAPVRGYQLWLALAGTHEHAPAESHYIETAGIEGGGTFRVLLGSYGAIESPIPYREPVTYLHVRLHDAQRFTFEANAGHEVAWLAVHQGALRCSGVRLEREMVVFEDGDGPVEIEAIGDAEFVIGSAPRHPHPLVCGYYSVHTSQAALVRGEQLIGVIAQTPQVKDAIRRTSR